MVSPTSINGSQGKKPTSRQYGDLLLYNKIAKTDHVKLLRDTSTVSPLMVALFGGSLIQSTSGKHPTFQSILLVDEWISVGLSRKDANTLLRFRNCLEDVIAASLKNLLRSRGVQRDQHEAFAREIEQNEAATRKFVDALGNLLQLDEKLKQSKPEVSEESVMAPLPTGPILPHPLKRLEKFWEPKRLN
ncbi:hypothetical protein L207DRAFT_598609 [Hyaloscypha variabilis F]|uniref:Uncharacterized protein n=1 Tax=Hyaloscypha variabilis (strain UAMH 11265 / GT02V1 / F) TaxID=1149755 RepID=A0A2J6RHR9_HYAVF|nr:hypothetical protein L207DRAFT_598609 [Hyaloscypha variabilis F]